MMKKSLQFILVNSLLIFALAGCNQSVENTDNEIDDMDTNENWEEFKAEMEDVGDAIGDLFEADDDNFKESANEVLSDFDRRVDNYRDELSAEEQEELNDLESQADDLESQLNELDENAEEGWAEAKADIEEGFRNFRDNLNELFDEDEY